MPRTPQITPQPGPPRILFLDDDPGRAEVFLAEHPEAVWVETAAACIARLEEPWDEVHLDHDLGGEHFVDHAREDCGMEVVRWLCFHSRPHLKRSRFLVHSHNPNAASMMAMQLMMNGYSVQARPFGEPDPAPPPVSDTSPRLSLPDRFAFWLRRVLRREDFGYPASRENLPRPDQLPLEHFDFRRLSSPPPANLAEPDPLPDNIAADDRPRP